MKTNFYKLTALIIIMSVLSACENEATTPEVDGADLIGTWTVTSAVSTNCDEADENGSFGTVCTSTDCLKVEFKPDGTFVSTELDGGVTTIDNGTYEVTGNEITITQGTDVQIATYEVMDDTLTLNGRENETGCDVTTNLAKDS